MLLALLPGVISDRLGGQYEVLGHLYASYVPCLIYYLTSPFKFYCVNSISLLSDSIVWLFCLSILQLTGNWEIPTFWLLYKNVGVLCKKGFFLVWGSIAHEQTKSLCRVSSYFTKLSRNISYINVHILKFFLGRNLWSTKHLPQKTLGKFNLSTTPPHTHTPFWQNRLSEGLATCLDYTGSERWNLCKKKPEGRCECLSGQKLPKYKRCWRNHKVKERYTWLPT